MNPRFSVNFQSLFSDLDGIKLATLYFDEINIAQKSICVRNGTGKRDYSRYEDVPDCMLGAIEEEYDFNIHSLPKSQLDQLNILVEEKILKIENTYFSTFDKSLQKFVYHTKSLLEKEDYSEYSKEIAFVKDTGCPIWTPDSEGGKLHSDGEFGMVVGFFTYLGLLNALKNNNSFCTDSNAIFQIFCELIKSQKINKRKYKKDYLAYKLLEVELPMISSASIEDVLEIRYKLRDELELFRTEMGVVSAELDESFDESFAYEVDKLIDTKINPAIIDLKNKITSSKSSFVKNLFENLKNPRSYVPLIGGVFAGIPSELVLGGSIALTSLESLLKTRMDKKEAKRENGFCYLLDLKKRIP